MNLLEKIEKDLRTALLKREERKVSTLRLLKASLKNLEIELRPKRKKLDEREVIKVIKKEIKKRKEAVEAYEKGERSDLLSKEKEELEILKNYLPEEISEEEIKKFIKEKIKELSPEINFGKIMGAVMKELAGQADGERVAELVKKELEKLKIVK